MKKLYNNKSILFALGFIFAVQIGYTQSLEWVKSADEETEHDIYTYDRVVKIDAAGNTYIAGSFYGTMDTDLSEDTYTISSMGWSDYIAKYDFRGDLLWTKTLQFLPDDSSATALYDIQLTGLDQVIICGSFYGSYDFDPSDDSFVLTTDSHSIDGYVWCLDANGDFVWAQKYGGSGHDYMMSINLDDESNLLITGIYSKIVDFDNGPDEVLEGAEGDSISSFILKIDLEGNFIWVKTIQKIETGTSRISDLSVNDDNEYYATGNFIGTMDADPGEEMYAMTSAEYNSTMILKFDSDGNFIWAKQIDGLNHVYPHSILSDTSGVYIYGYMAAETDFDPGEDVFNLYTGSRSNSYLLKLDEEGNFEWANHVGGSANITPTAIELDSDGYIFATGYYENGDADLDPTADSIMVETPGDWEVNRDFFIQKFNTGGQLLWAHASEAKGNEKINDIDIQGDQLLIYGKCEETETNFNLEGGSATIPRSDDYFLWNLNLCQHGTRDTLNVSECESYTVPSGDETYYASGSYTDTTTFFGCENIFTINLEVYDHPGYITFDGLLYKAHPEGERVVYKWVDCDNDFAIIPGQTEKYFYPRTEGNYAAIITVDGCSDTTECLYSGPLSLNEQEATLGMRIHPNPTQGAVNITIAEATTIQIYSTVGELIWQQDIPAGQNQIDLNGFAKGLYFVTAKGEDGQQTAKEKLVVH